jgi:DNA-directed RNA polymerase specialized sigma24 family protein
MPKTPQPVVGPEHFAGWVGGALPQVEQYLARRFGDAQLAAECAGEAVSRLWQAWHADPGAFASEAHMLNWCKRAARFQAIDRLRWRNRHLSLSVGGEGGAPNGEGPALRPLYAQDADRGQERAGVWACLQTMPRADRDLLTGHFYDGVTDVEAGRRLFGRRGSAQARGLRAWRRRRAAQEELGRRLVEAGLSPAGC